VILNRQYSGDGELYFEAVGSSVFVSNSCIFQPMKASRGLVFSDMALEGISGQRTLFQLIS
jgi:hypothetical protein